ncbi:MAG: hypothetical protein K6E40_03210 [Desulfovibrio sp.]|nr:hypothetical protein [Desulfovibrio sp.]
MAKKARSSKAEANQQSLADLMSMAGAGVPTPIPATPPAPAEQVDQPKAEANASSSVEERGSLGDLPDGASVRATARLGIRIQQGLKRRFEAVAKAQGLTMSEMTVELIRRAVDAGEAGSGSS